MWDLRYFVWNLKTEKTTNFKISSGKTYFSHFTLNFKFLVLKIFW